MRFLSIACAALAAAALLPTSGLAATISPPVVRVAVLFFAMDRNGDGVIERSEADAMRAVVFDAIDTNHDGRITKQEAGLVLVPAKQGLPQKQADKLSRKREALLVKLSLDKPEGISKDEFVGRNAELFTAADKNGDGKIDHTEFLTYLGSFGGLLP